MSAPDDAALPPELVSALQAYGVSDSHVVRLSGGLLHTSYAVTAGGREYIAQRVNPIFSPRIHDNIRRVTRHLAERGVETFDLVATRSGEDFVDLEGGGRWRLLTRLPGVSYDVCGNPEQARAAAAAIGEFHAALRDFEGPLHPLGFAFHDTPAHLADLERALADNEGHPLRREVASLADEVSRIAARWSDLGALPERVIHGDLKFSNILFREPVAGEPPRALALIDLDTLCRLPLYFDLGDAWRSWCNPRGEDDEHATLDLAIFRASAEGYLDVPGLELGRPELASLAEALERLSLELCARFAADALVERHFDWDRDRFESAGHHNLVRARGQLDLCRQARETREERVQFLGL